MTRAAVATWGLVLAACLLLGGCAEEPTTLDPAGAELEVGRTVAGQVDAPVIDVRCPDELPLGAGEAFACDVELADPAGTLPVGVVQLDDAGALEVTLRRAVVDDAEVADQLRKLLAEEFGRTFQVDCGSDPASVREPGDTAVCRANDGASRRSVEVTFDDELGSLSFALVDP